MGIAAGLNRRRGRRAVWNGRGCAVGPPSDDPSPSGRARPPPSPPTGSSKPRRASPNSSADRPAASGSPFFSRSLAALGRGEPRTASRPPLRGHRNVIADEPQGLAHDEANIRRLCALARGFARRLLSPLAAPCAAAREDADMRDLIHRIALDDRHYGYRRVAARVGRQGQIVNAQARGAADARGQPLGVARQTVRSARPR